MAIRDAVSAVFFFENKLFMVQRQPYLTAFPGYHSFPGGKVDRDEADTPFQTDMLATAPPRLMHALVREVSEELHFDMEAAVHDGLITGINEFAVATAPSFNRVRFRNHFFRIDVTRIPEFLVDKEEAECSGWFTPAELIARYDEGLFLAVPPVLKMMQYLLAHPNATQIPDIEFVYDADTEVPCMELFRDFYMMPVRSNTLPPANRTNAFVVGGVLVDPSPENEAELARLEKVLDRLTVDRIMLTHHHFDHHQFANVLARKRGWPICISLDSHQRIQTKQTGYFDGIQVHHLADGDVLTQWRGSNVMIHAVPGHDEGQLAIAPESLAWFVVGDLIQGMGTVVVHAPEGHMGRYFNSLQKVIDLDPKIIIPSHGGAMGTTYRLRATLEHRIQRETQIYNFWREGRSQEDILKGVYRGLDSRLAPFAMANIQSHLTKLREEGRIT